jgi:hypothetical protein
VLYELCHCVHDGGGGQGGIVNGQGCQLLWHIVYNAITSTHDSEAGW